MGDVHCLVPPSEPGQPDSVKVVPIDDLLKLLQAGELLPTTKVFMPPEQTAADAVQLKRLVNMKAVKAQKKRAGTIKELDAAVAAEQQAATVAQQQLDQAHADVSDTQAKVDSWAATERLAETVVAVGLSMVAAVALDKQYAQALEAATIVVETVAAGLIAEDEAAREVATEYEAAAAEPVAMPSKWQQISALEQAMREATAAEDFDECEQLARELVTLEASTDEAD